MEFGEGAIVTDICGFPNELSCGEEKRFNKGIPTQA